MLCSVLLLKYSLSCSVTTQYVLRCFDIILYKINTYLTKKTSIIHHRLGAGIVAGFYSSKVVAEEHSNTNMTTNVMSSLTSKLYGGKMT